MTSTDECFPRGGFKPTANSDSSIKKPKKQENLFGNAQPVKKTKTKKKRQTEHAEVEATSVKDFVNKTDALVAVSADTLSYKKIHEGMSILACVQQINTMTVNVELPGRCGAEILVQNISTIHTNLLSEAVQNGGEDLPSLGFLHVGMFLPVKVLSIDNGEKLRIYVSCNPTDVNAHYKHADFTKHMLVWGAIKEKSDHGYLIDLGVKNCRAHLAFTEVDGERDLPVGSVLYMAVLKSVSSQEASTLTLSATRTAFDKTVESLGTSLDKTIPGMQVEFLTQRHLKDGLQGQFFDECTGFINDLYLQKQFDSAKRYKEFASVRARLLYVHPVSKLGYFTLKSLYDPHPAEKLSVGDWLASTIVGRAGSGLVVKLQGGSKGFITYRRLLHAVKTKEKELDDLATLIANKFPAGTAKHCTILDYNHMERMYICTFEQITEVMNMRQLKLAQVVKGTVKEINNYGMVIRVGKLDTFAPKDNIANVRFSSNIMKQFKVGQEVTAKVWNINIEKRDVILTLKPELIQSKVHLTSYKDISLSEQYPGVVITTNPTGVLLLFYGGVKGWLPVRSIPQLGNKNPSNEFYRGQVVKARAVHCEDEKLTLTLNLTERKRIRVGKLISKPKVSNVTDDGLFVMAGNTEAFVPKEQLAVEGLGKLLLPTYKIGDVLDEELICLVDTNPPILSVRECLVHQREQLRIPALNELKPNVLLRAMVKDRQLINVPLRMRKHEFEVTDNFMREFKKYETILVKVETMTKKKDVTWKLRLDNVFNYSFLETLTLLDQYLQDVERVRNQLRHVGNALGDLEVGATVDCVVNKVDPHRGCSVFVVPMNCQGLVSINDCPEKLEAGSQVKGKVLWVNYELKYAAITLNPKIMEKIGDTQDQTIDMLALHQRSDKASLEILHANRNLAVGVLREKFNRQLVYLPVRLNENDIKAKTNVYDAFVGKQVCVRLTKMRSGRLLAVTATMLEALNHKRKKCDEIIILRKGAKQLKKERQEKAKPVENKKDKKKKEKKNKIDKKIKEIKDEDEGIESSEEIKSEIESIKNEPEDNEEEDEEMVEEDEEESEEIEEESEEIEEESEEIEEESEELEKDEEEEDEEISEEMDDNEDNEEINENEDSKKEDKQIQKTKENISKKKRKLQKTEELTKQPKKQQKLDEDNKISVVLPGMSSFFDEDLPAEVKEESDDETETTTSKKKLTPAERLQKAKDEEARLRKIESDLADTSVLPQNAEQFDRALLGNPDDSELWTRYIAFHAQSTEFEKARAVAKRAIERISYTALQDRLNVWLAYLNLENMYGTKDSFKSLFDEAARCNDTLTIYLESIKMMAEMSKFVEMEELIRKARGKFKQELQMWLEIGKVYYKCGKFAEARKFKDNAILILVDKKSHMLLIVQYAIMEFTFGESNQGEALFETILQADPKRVDIWCTYVDQLIKKEKIDLARNVLTRAVGQKLAYKKMRTLFKKYHSFETAYGDEETIAHVTNLLREYSEQ